MNNMQNLKTPVYICDTGQFKKNITDFRDAIKTHYPRYRMGYSFKTNYYAGFINAVRELGECAEVVSPKELEMAVAAGFRYQDIIYNGVIEDFNAKILVVLGGGIVNIDNLDEFKTFVEWSEKTQIVINIGIRVNIDIGSGVFSRFGIEVGSEDFMWIVDKDNHPFVNVKSVHCHLSQARSLEFFKRRVEKMADVARVLGADIIDIGGNMFGKMDNRFKIQFPEYVPTFEEYADVIGRTMAEQFPDGDKLLITEDGTPVVSNAMHLLSKVIAIKTIRGQHVIVLDTKREDVGASCITKIPSTVNVGGAIPLNRIEAEDAVVFGCTCVEIDYLLRKYNGPIGKGDKLLFLNIGAYSINNGCDFITDKPRCIKAEDVPDYEKIVMKK